MKNAFKKLRWYYATRALGFFMVTYELLTGSSNPQQGTIILVGAGILGYDFVVHRSDKEIEIVHRDHPDDEKDD